MRVFVLALAAALVGCSTPQHVFTHTGKVHKIIARMKRRPGHHKRAGGKIKAAINATQPELRSPGLDERSAAERIAKIISAKLGNPASIEIPDIAPGKAADSFCGVAEVEDTPGEEREMAFAYLVQRNELYIVDGSNDRRAGAAIHFMCDR